MAQVSLPFADARALTAVEALMSATVTFPGQQLLVGVWLIRPAGATAEGTHGCKAPKSLHKFPEEVMPRVCLVNCLQRKEKNFSLSPTLQAACNVQRVLIKHCVIKACEVIIAR